MKITPTFLLKALSQRRPSGGKSKDYFFLVGLFFFNYFVFVFIYFVFHDTPRLTREDVQYYQTVFLRIPRAEIFQFVAGSFAGKFQLQQ